MIVNVHFLLCYNIFKSIEHINIVVTFTKYRIECRYIIINNTNLIISNK